jgi:hypothetical protein
MRPAIRIIFAPLSKRIKEHREQGLNTYGQSANRTIWLDPRNSEILDTLVHELAHVNHPSWSEEEVLDYTKKRMKKMGWKEKARLLKLLGYALIEGEKDASV